MKPRDSMPTTLSICGRRENSQVKRSTVMRSASGSLSSVVMSKKLIPGFGKSGTSRM